MPTNSQMGLFPAETSDKSTRNRSRYIPIVISSLELVDGDTPLSSLDGLEIGQYGRDRVHVSPTQSQENAAATKTNETSGPPSAPSSMSVDLQSFLENRLPARMEGRGSTLYRLTWKAWVMPLGRRISALRGSVPRTSGNGSIGWPSPIKTNANGADYAYSRGNHEKKTLQLGGAAKMCGWPSPLSSDQKGPISKKSIKKGRGDRLAGVTRLVPWPTPCVSDQNGAREPNMKRGPAPGLQCAAAMAGWQTPKLPSGGGWTTRKPTGGGLRKLEDQVLLATCGQSLTALNLQVQLTVPGVAHNGSHVEAGTTARLDPTLPRWLMAYPAAWDRCSPEIESWQLWQGVLSQISGMPSATSRGG